MVKVFLNSCMLKTFFFFMIANDCNDSKKQDKNCFDLEIYAF